MKKKTHTLTKIMGSPSRKTKIMGLPFRKYAKMRLPEVHISIV